MLIDLRTYTFMPGKVPAFLNLFEAEGLAIQQRHCGHLVGYFTADTGTQNQVVQMWAYRDAADRDARRAGLWKDEGWLAFGQKALPLISHQENRLLTPTRFSPLR